MYKKVTVVYMEYSFVKGWMGCKKRSNLQKKKEKEKIDI